MRTIVPVNSDVYTSVLIAKGADEIDHDTFFGRGLQGRRKAS